MNMLIYLIPVALFLGALGLSPSSGRCALASMRIWTGPPGVHWMTVTTDPGDHKRRSELVVSSRP